jgi:hypothetical protein
MISCSTKFLHKAKIILIYKALVVSYLKYCVSLWGGASYYLINPLFRAQKKALRGALAAPFNSQTDPLFFKLKTFKLQDLYEYNLAKIGSDLVHKIAPLGVIECFTILHPDEKLRSKTQPFLLIPSCCTDLLQRNSA